MTELSIVTVIQARTGSTRLPEKVLLDICGKPLLLRMVERVQLSRFAGRVVVATSTKPEDDIIEKLCRKNDISCFRGHPTDLLDRHYQAGLKYLAEAVVKIPSDCPLIDPKVIDKVISFYLDNIREYDFVSNLHPATYPDGNDVEIISFHKLKIAWEHATKEYEREHTTPHFWENPDKFAIGNVKWETGQNFSASHRWTIDYEEDYQFIKRVYEELYHYNPAFELSDILNLLDKKPEIEEINKKYQGRYWYENHLEELKNIDEFKKQMNKES
ncbi:MAG: glycosyltransferase family protein [Bacteroidetes bacterium]|nr:glycosyltransferase family protein [Bacteroidota bacterium]